MATPRLSLAQQIAQLEEAAPVDFDPEDTQLTGGDPENEASTTDQTAAREHYLDVGPSALRKLRDSIADPKYEGVRTSRKQMFEEDSEEGEHSDLNSDEGSEGGAEDQDEDIPSHSEQEEETEQRISKSPSPPPKRPAPVVEDTAPMDDLSSTLRKTRDEDRKKGKAVSRQIALWDSLLDARIRLQKSANAANKLPAPSDIPRFTNTPECREAVDKMLEEAVLLSNEIFELQETLLDTNESLNPPARKKRKIYTDVDRPDYDSELRDSSSAEATLENAFHPYLVQTLSKWSSKIQAVAPSVLLPSNRNTFSAKSAQHLKSAVQLIDETLVDHSKVLARTQIRRGKGPRLGAEDLETDKDKDDMDVDVEVFDDTDFYQQLLRDVIDARGNGVGGGDDWMVVQKQKKAKKKVDTKASKGRKLRYEVHEKIQNYMVPVPVQGGWHEEQIDELFASILGKGFEGVAGIDEIVGTEGDVDAANRLEDELKWALKGGFRVF